MHNDVIHSYCYYTRQAPAHPPFCLHYNTLTFEKLIVKELQDFLREKGVSTTGHTKVKLVKLAAAVADLSLPVDPDLAGLSHSIAGTV